MKRLSFITQFKIEFLLPFTGCRKVLGKMPVHWIGWGDFETVVIHIFPFSPDTYSRQAYLMGSTFWRIEIYFIKHQFSLISSLIRSVC